MLALPGAPFGLTYRELWLPPGIKGWTGPLPPSVEGGHELTFTGARRGTTVDGVHFTGAADSNINCGAIHNASAKLWISFRFRLDQPFSVASTTNFYLWGKYIDPDNFISAWLDQTNGKLWFHLRTAAATRFTIAAQAGGMDIDNWEAGRWYHGLFSISDTAGIGRLRIDNDTIVLTNDVNPAPNGGDLVFGDQDDPGAGTGFEGVEVDVFVGTDDLTVAEEADLFNGIPPADAVNAWLLDEGRGVTAYDRGSGGNNGTLDTTATWAFGQVQLPVISFDSINDQALSPAAEPLDLSGDWTMLWAGKMKSTYNGLNVTPYIFEMFLDGNNRFRVAFTGGILNTSYIVGGAATTVGAIVNPAIDDYYIMLVSKTLGGVLRFYINAALQGVNTDATPQFAGNIRAYFGRGATAFNGDISKPLIAALMDGAFTNQQALAYSRYLRNIFNLPISI